MLKLTYTEFGLNLERVATSLETLISQQVVLTVQLGQPVHLEPGQAAFLLPANTPELAQLKSALHMEEMQKISIAAVDAEFVEVSVHGVWIADSTEAETGTFVTSFSDRAEFLIHYLWQAAQPYLPFLADG